MPEFAALWAEGERKEGEVRAIGKAFAARCEIPAQLAGCRQAEELLPREAVEVLRGAAPGGEGAMLLLEESLPDQLVRLEWESLTIAGRELEKSVLVVRRARPKFENSRPSSEHPARWLNLFPRVEFDFSKPLEELIAQGALRPTTRATFADDIARVCDLFVVAHANEYGLLDSSGMSYTIPQAAILPARVWLLACNKSEAMNSLACALLDRGVGAVVSATGDLSAPEMLEAIRSWLMRPKGMELETWLLANRAAGRFYGGIGSLRLWGEILLDGSQSSTWNAATWAIDHGDAGTVPLGMDATADEYASAKTAYGAPETWPRTREWMAPCLLWLAESYDHPSIPFFERAVGRPSTAHEYGALAIAARRLGHYPLALRNLVQGMRTHTATQIETAILFGHLANLLIDLDLPKGARAAVSRLEDCVIPDPGVREESEFRRLDFLARIAAREGKLQVALDRMQEKQAVAQRNGDDGRELAGLLYLSAWSNQEGGSAVSTTRGMAQEVVRRLSDVSSEQVGSGNETTAYLIRALAAYYWASSDENVLFELKRWEPICMEALRREDPGPWGYVIAFLFLAKQAKASAFERAMEALERARYLLEQAIFLLLSGRIDEAKRSLSRFQQRRQRTLTEWSVDVSNLPCDLENETLTRSKIEQDCLWRADHLVTKGLIPL